MNFVIFMPDQQRAEVLGCYGHPQTRTPNYDRLAGEGTRFDQCHVQMPLCSPSRCCMMTGWYPHVKGHRSIPHLLGRDDPSLLRTLRENGYRVEVYGKNDVFDAEHTRLATDRAVHRWGGVPERIHP
ncbi:MAG: sulfatase-like hydrolase/transferase, partial [Planctomycetes bacterium]|nr:sulfatase-like hydrolase/transferase [Planctomycetota bacterium]